MTIFIFMLTKDDATVPNAEEVYDVVRGTGVSHVGFKDIGSSAGMTRRLVSAIKLDGRTSVLELVGVDREAQVAAAEGAAAAGFDIVMGGTFVSEVAQCLMDSGVQYFPFPGRVVGHPSVLTGSVSDIVSSVRTLADIPGVHGLDILAYRWERGNVPEMIAEVVAATTLPVVVAGSIDTLERAEEVCALGVWGFTVGSAIFDGLLTRGATISEQVASACQVAARHTRS